MKCIKLLEQSYIWTNIKPSFFSFWKDSMIYVAFVLHASCVPEKVGISRKWYSISNGEGRG